MKGEGVKKKLEPFKTCLAFAVLCFFFLFMMILMPCIIASFPARVRCRNTTLESGDQISYKPSDEYLSYTFIVRLVSYSSAKEKLIKVYKEKWSDVHYKSVSVKFVDIKKDVPKQSSWIFPINTALGYNEYEENTLEVTCKGSACRDLKAFFMSHSTYEDSLDGNGVFNPSKHSAVLDYFTDGSTQSKKLSKLVYSDVHNRVYLIFSNTGDKDAFSVTFSSNLSYSIYDTDSFDPVAFSGGKAKFNLERDDAILVEYPTSSNNKDDPELIDVEIVGESISTAGVVTPIFAFLVFFIIAACYGEKHFIELMKGMGRIHPAGFNEVDDEEKEKEDEVKFTPDYPTFKPDENNTAPKKEGSSSVEKAAEAV